MTRPDDHRPSTDVALSITDVDTTPIPVLRHLAAPATGPQAAPAPEPKTAPTTGPQPVSPPAQNFGPTTGQQTVPSPPTTGQHAAPAQQPPPPPPSMPPAAGPPAHTPHPPNSAAPRTQPPAPPAPPAPRPNHAPGPSMYPPIATPFTNATPGASAQYPGARPMPSPSELGLIRRTKQPPQAGWRKVVHRVTGINPGESDKENTQRRLVERVNQPVHGDYSIALLSMKGGVGKTTTTVGLGSTFAAIRGDRVIAVDANPDFGTLAQRGPDQSRSTVRDLLLDESIFRYSDIRRHTSQNSSRLEILASERDPATSESFSEADYRVVIRMLQRFYNIILTDCGTGLVHSAMTGVLDEADAIVLVASPAIDSARSGLATLDWLAHHGYAHLIPGATVVVSAARPGQMSVDIDMLGKQFLARVRAVHILPFDDHLAQGSEVVLDLLGWKTRQAFLELAATMADGFSITKRSERG